MGTICYHTTDNERERKCKMIEFTKELSDKMEANLSSFSDEELAQKFIGCHNEIEQGKRKNQFVRPMLNLTLSDKEKIGNTVIYIAQRVPNLSKTKLLKLLYFMEDYSVKRFHTPFLGLPFEVWQAGPVIKDIFIDLSERPIILADYIEKAVNDNKTYIKPKKQFCDDEFSHNDIIVMDDTLKRYGDMSATDLVKLTHQKNGLWYKVCKENNLLERFNSGCTNNSDYTIDLGDNLSGCSKEFYEEQLSFLNGVRNYGK